MCSSVSDDRGNIDHRIFYHAVTYLIFEIWEEANVVVFLSKLASIVYWKFHERDVYLSDSQGAGRVYGPLLSGTVLR